MPDYRPTLADLLHLADPSPPGLVTREDVAQLAEGQLSLMTALTKIPLVRFR